MVGTGDIMVNKKDIVSALKELASSGRDEEAKRQLDTVWIIQTVTHLQTSDGSLLPTEENLYLV